MEEEDQETKEQFKLPVRSVSVRNLMVVFTFSPPECFLSRRSFNILYLTLGNISFNLIFPSLPHSVCSRAAVKFAAVWQVLHSLNGRRVFRHISLLTEAAVQEG